MLNCALSLVADDLTGAADSAVAFASCGITSCVVWSADDIRRLSHVPVLSIDTETRRLSATEAARRNVNVLEHCSERGELIFKKVDSTLRGQLAAEIAAMWDHLRRRRDTVLGVFAPASPLTGTTTRDGYAYRSGRALDSLPLWRTEHLYDTASLAEIMSTVNVATTLIPLATVRSGLDRLKWTLTNISQAGTAIAICDATEQTDLDQVARASLSCSGCKLFIGSGGLAKSVAREMSHGAPGCIGQRVNFSDRGALIVVGSAAIESQGAASRLARASHLLDYQIMPATKGSPGVILPRGVISEVIRSLRSGDDVLVRIGAADGLPVLNPNVISELAKSLSPVLCQASAFVATGGETAFALLGEIGAREIRPVRELEPGIVLGMAIGQTRIPIVTKAGGFGGEATLCSVVDYLRSTRDRGAV